MSGFLALLPGFPQNPQPRDSSSGRHPSGKTANLRHWYLVPWLFSLAFPETHNPLFQPEAATPPGRRPVTDTGFWLQSPADVPQRPVLRPFSLTFLEPITPHFNRKPSSLREDGQSPALVSSSPAFLSGFPRNPQPLVSAGSRHPYGETVNRGSPSPDFRGSGSPVLFPHYPQPRIFPTTRDPSGQSANCRQGFPEIPTGLCPSKLQSRHSQIAKGTPGFLNMPGDR